MNEELTDEQMIEIFIKLGMTKEYAEFVLAMQKGEINGDIAAVDKSGNEISVKPTGINRD